MALKVSCQTIYPGQKNKPRLEQDQRRSYKRTLSRLRIVPPKDNAGWEKKMADNRIGSVMVVGGGIAGMQASLDLANSGYYVYLVERSSSIGGVMSQLDKTFPTNDCSM